MAFTGNWASAHLDPGPRQPVIPFTFMRGGFGPLGSLGPGQHTGVVKCCRPQEGLQEAGPLGPAGFLGNEQGPGLCHPHRRSRPTLGGGQDVPPRGTQPAQAQTQQLLL